MYEQKYSIIHPLQNDQEKLFKDRVAKEPLGEISNAKAAQLGNNITMKILPAVIYIHIRKNVEAYALQILAKQLVKHAQGVPTRILLKQNVHGKFTYNVWVPTKVMETLDDNTLYERLQTVTKQRKKSVTIIIRQTIREGHLHELWEREHSFV